MFGPWVKIQKSMAIFATKTVKKSIFFLFFLAIKIVVWSSYIKRSKMFYKRTRYPICHPKMYYKKIYLKSFAKFIGKHLCQSFFFDKLTGCRSAKLLKKRLLYKFFFVSFAIFLRTYLSQNTCEHLLLKLKK